MRDYNIWYWTEGPGKGQYSGGGGGGSTAVPDPPPIPPPASTPAPAVIEPAKPPPVEQTFVNWGKVIPISMGMRRMSPQIIWLKAPVFIGVTVKADFAMSWGYNADDNPGDTECVALYANGTKIWTIEDGKRLPGNWSWKWYPGTESQGQNPTMVADKGAANTPAYRNQMYGVFRDFPLEKFGFKLPGISAEIMGSGSEGPRVDSWNPDDKHELVVLENNNMTLSKYVPPGWVGDIGDDDIGNYFSPSGVRSRTYHKRGQYYYEMRADYLWRGAWYSFAGWTGVGAGIALGTAGLAKAAGWQVGGAGTAAPVPYTGLINPSTNPDGAHGDLAHRTAASQSGSTAGPPLWNNGETFAVHINMTAGYIRARNVSSGSAWTEPVYYARGTGPNPGHPFLAIDLGDPLYAYANVAYAPTIFLITATDKQTVNFGGPFLGAIPAGATAWNGTGGADVFLGTLPLKDFISKIALYSGLDPTHDLEFVSIDAVIHGGIITQDTEFRSFLGVLGRAYGFDYYEGDVIRIVKRVVQASYTIDKAIPTEDLLNDTDRAITTTRRKDDSPNEIELNYIDVTQQFRWNLQKARRILFPVRTTESQRKDSFSIPIVTTANDALTMASKAMYREAEQNVDHEMKVTSKHFGIEPSDIITITAADTEYTVKVAQVNIEEDMRITLRVVNLQTDEDMEFDAEAGEPALPYAGNIAYMAATEGADHMAFSQLTGTMWAYEGEDTAAFRSNVLILNATEGADGFETITFTGALAATDRPDTFAASDAVVGDPTLTLDLNFTADTYVIYTPPFVWWDASTATAVTLSGSNLVVTNTGTTSADQGVHIPAVMARGSGKFYFEVTFTTLAAGGNYGVGVGTTTSTYTNMGNTSQTGSMMYRSGNIWFSGSYTGSTLGARASGDVIGVAIDLDNYKAWYRVGPSGNWNASGSADPATNVGGTIIAGSPSTMIPFVTFGGTGGVANNVMTANFGASAFTGAVPSGFTSGWPT